MHCGYRHHQPAVGDAGRARDSCRHLRADQDRRTGLLERPRVDADVVELPVATVMRDAVFGPQPANDLDALGEPAHPLDHRHLEDGELLGPIAEPHAEHESPARDQVEEGADLRQLDRVVQRKEDEVGPHPHSFDLGGQALEHRQQWKVVEAGSDVVLSAPDRVESQPANQPRLLQQLGEAAGGIVGGRMLRIQVDAELHRLRRAQVRRIAAMLKPVVMSMEPATRSATLRKRGRVARKPMRPASAP